MEIKGSETRIVWAIDPFARDRKLLKRTAMAIRALTKGKAATVEPIYIYRARPLNAAFPASEGGFRKTSGSARKELEKLCAKVRIAGIRPLRTVCVPGLTTRLSAQLMVDLARKWKADMIVSSTRSRTGPIRWAMGSFAEALTLESDTPLFFVNPSVKPQEHFRDILFPTDFSDESRDAFERVIAFAKTMGSRLTVYHKIFFDWPPAVELGVSNLELYRQAFKSEIELKTREAGRWAKRARAAGLMAKAVIDHRAGIGIADSILAQERKHPGLIAMASHSGIFSSVFFGSATRKVLRGALCPLWVIHPATERRAKAKGQKNEILYSVTEGDVAADLHLDPAA